MRTCTACDSHLEHNFGPATLDSPVLEKPKAKQGKVFVGKLKIKSVSQSRRQLLGNLNATSTQDRSPLGSEDCNLEHLEELPKSRMRIQVVCGLGNRGLCYPVLFQYSTVDLDGP